jgi:hypothetical protein
VRRDGYDTALAEAIDGLCKAEILSGKRSSRSLEAVEHATIASVDWSNDRRLRAPIGNVPPAEAEVPFFAALEEEGIAACPLPDGLRDRRGG